MISVQECRNGSEPLTLGNRLELGMTGERRKIARTRTRTRTGARTRTRTRTRTRREIMRWRRGIEGYFVHCRGEVG
jgi:hypothetical protein